ncbi:MAG: T9SS type A sorting domain-containing protein [Ignavibacteriae bacterium]|nr:T9SS type A sorting domain-containing protein [Ignavibacteriota bacterium]
MNKFIVAVITLLTLNSSLIILNSDAQWVNYTLPYNGIAGTIGFFNANTGVSSGSNMSSLQLYYTTNAGSNWVLSTYPLEINNLADVQFMNSSIVYACGNEAIAPASYRTAFLKSANSGITWVKVGASDTLKGSMDNMHFFDANTGYALIDSSLTGNTRLYKTTNVGVNWQRIQLIEAGMKLNNLYFFDMNTGIISGKKYNGGPAGLYGVIYKTTNGGISFIKTTYSGASEIRDFTFLNSTTGIATGFSKTGGTTIYRTTNSGSQWDSILYLSTRTINNIESIQNTGTAFAIGNMMDTINGYIVISTIKTTNYGTNWVVKDINQNTLVSGLSLIDQNKFMMSGGDLYSNPYGPARIFISTNGGNVFVNQIGSNVPSSYSLGQNYPNPFNPRTAISLCLPVVSFVSLKVYDIMGREVQTLVNENLQPGTYETTLDGSMLNSGVYFYKLVTDGYSETKRMLLVK